MKQRVPTRAWYSPGRPGRRPRVLVEDDHPALAISDFSQFGQAGFDVAYCSGPGVGPGDCPVLRGQRCALLDGADAVLHGLDPGLGVAVAIQQHRPGLPVVRPPGGCSVPGQIAAVRQALARPGR
ncbi:MAG TPA: hypothetical protein VMH35_13050 [Streptosporangiaceae bacterium]|nr:hypothetical protein [Streptosporangiaceae bacterium]